MKAYSEYKSSGIDWLGEIPSHWDCVKTAWLFDQIGSGTTPTSVEDAFYKGGTINWLQTGDLNDGIINVTSKKVTEYAVKTKGLRLYPKRSLVIAMYGATIAKLGLLDIDTTVNQACCVLVKSKKVNSNFIFYFFQVAKNELISLASGGGQPNISQSTIYDFKVTVPPLKEQGAIATYLDDVTGKVDALIAEKQKQVEDLRAYRNLIITETVTRGLNPDAPLRHSGIDWLGEIPSHWSVIKLKYALSEIKDGTHFSPDTCEEGYSYVTATDVRGVGIDYASTKKVNESNFLKLRQTGCEIFKDDVLIVKDGATTGRVGYKNDEVLAVTLSSVAILRVKKCDSPKYFMYLLESKMIQSQISDAMAGAAMPRITLEKLGNFIGITPSINEQQAIAEFLDEKTSKIDALINELSKQLDELAEYKKAVISEAVTGKVDLRDWKPNN